MTGNWRRTAVAVAVAYALFVQGLLLALGGALHAEAATGPQAFICAQGPSSGSTPSPAKTHDGSCCTLSCHGSASVMPPPAGASIERSAPVAAALHIPGEVFVGIASDVLPVGSRAPPRLG